MPRKWEFSKGHVALAVEKGTAARWRVVTLVVRQGIMWMGKEKGYMKNYYWGLADHRRKVKFFYYHINTKEAAEEIARRKGAELGLEYIPGIHDGDSVLTLVDGLIQGLSTLG